jgi:hypothetical protein
MSTLVNALRTKNTLTENGMVTHSSSLNDNLDLFFVIGASRSKMKDEDGRQDLINQFVKAHAEDPLISRKMMFWARDIRGGAGEREVFRTLLRYSAENYTKEIIDNIHLIA